MRVTFVFRLCFSAMILLTPSETVTRADELAAPCRIVVVPFEDTTPEKTLTFFLTREGGLRDVDGHAGSYEYLKKALAKPGRSGSIQNVMLVINDETISAKIIGSAIGKLADCCKGQDKITVLLCFKAFK